MLDVFSPKCSCFSNVDPVDRVHGGRGRVPEPDRAQEVQGVRTLLPILGQVT